MFSFLHLRLISKQLYLGMLCIVLVKHYTNLPLRQEHQIYFSWNLDQLHG